MRLVALLATVSHRAESGNNDRLSTPWREVISLYRCCKVIVQNAVVPKLAVPRSIRGARWKIKKAGAISGSDMRSNDVIEFVTPWTH